MNSPQNGGPSTGTQYCRCKARAWGNNPDTGEPLCQKHFEEDQVDRDMKYLREMRQQYEEQVEAGLFDRDPEDEVVCTPSDTITVGSVNYIRVQVIQPIVDMDPEKEPYARVIMMLGEHGNYIDYSLAQYEGLVKLMTEQLDALRDAIYKQTEEANRFS